MRCVFMYCKNVDTVKDTVIFDAEKVYPAIIKSTTAKKTVKFFRNFKFRNFAELFYFVTFPLRSGFGDFYTNNICKSTVN